MLPQKMFNEILTGYYCDDKTIILTIMDVYAVHKGVCCAPFFFRTQYFDHVAGEWSRYFALMNVKQPLVVLFSEIRCEIEKLCTI